MEATHSSQVGTEEAEASRQERARRNSCILACRDSRVNIEGKVVLL